MLLHINLKTSLSTKKGRYLAIAKIRFLVQDPCAAATVISLYSAARIAHGPCRAIALAPG